MKPIILASSSAARRKVLTNAGVEFDVAAADVDEAAIKTMELAGGCGAHRLASILAEAKALEVARRAAVSNEALVIGADQTLEWEGGAMDKARSKSELRDTLGSLRGRRHALHAAVCVARNDEIVWSHVDTAWLTMRDFSPAFLDDYLARNGEAVESSLGGYWYEGEGAQLLDSVDGDYFTVLGMPLLPLLGFLRREGALLS